VRFGLTEATIDLLCGVFSDFPEIEKVILYGSRAKGTFRKGSDIDLTLLGDNLDLSTLNRILWAIDDLLIPYKVDLSLYSMIESEELIKHIDRVGKTFYDASGSREVVKSTKA
jgi:predicted nucleotidyltransferase